MSHKKKIIVMEDPKEAYEKAAEEISKLRRKGIPCHLEDESNGRTNFVDVMEDEDPAERSKQQNEGH